MSIGCMWMYSERSDDKKPRELSPSGFCVISKARIDVTDCPWGKWEGLRCLRGGK